MARAMLIVCLAALVAAALGSDCVVSEWTPGPCSATCGGGIRTEFRSIVRFPGRNGAACPPLQRTVTCNNEPCVVCSGGRIFSTCSRSCTPTCEEPFPVCSTVCSRPRCECPSHQVLNQRLNRCVAPSSCPVQTTTRRTTTTTRFTTVATTRVVTRQTTRRATTPSAPVCTVQDDGVADGPADLCRCTDLDDTYPFQLNTEFQARYCEECNGLEDFCMPIFPPLCQFADRSIQVVIDNSVEGGQDLVQQQAFAVELLRHIGNDARIGAIAAAEQEALFNLTRDPRSPELMAVQALDIVNSTVNLTEIVAIGGMDAHYIFLTGSNSTSFSDGVSSQIVVFGDGTVNEREGAVLIDDTTSARTLEGQCATPPVLPATPRSVQGTLTCSEPTDVVILLDRSTSTEPQFTEMVSTARSLIDELVVSEELTRVALVIFGREASSVLPSGFSGDKAAVLQALDTVSFEEDSSSIGGALAFVRDELPGRRIGDASFSIVLFSDGFSQDNTAGPVAAGLRGGGAKIFSIASGSVVNTVTLAEVASSPSSEFLLSLSSVASAPRNLAPLVTVPADDCSSVPTIPPVPRGVSSGDNWEMIPIVAALGACCLLACCLMCCIMCIPLCCGKYKNTTNTTNREVIHEVYMDRGLSDSIVSLDSVYSDYSDDVEEEIDITNMGRVKTNRTYGSEAGEVVQVRAPFSLRGNIPPQQGFMPPPQHDYRSFAVAAPSESSRLSGTTFASSSLSGSNISGSGLEVFYVRRQADSEA